MSLDRKCHHDYEHGHLHICSGYSEETKIELRKLQKQFADQCRDGTVNITCKYRDGSTTTKTWNEWIDY